MRKINMDNLRRYYTQAITRLQDGKLKITKSLGGKNKMETKSRYEVIAELEDKKRSLIKERDSFADKVKESKRELRDAKREVEDSEEALKEFEESIDERKVTIKELIQSIDESLNRFSKISEKK